MKFFIYVEPLGSLEISKLKETFREAVRILLQIINSPKTPVRQKIAACDALCRTASADLQLTYQGPLIMNRAIKDIDLAWHFKGHFVSGEVYIQRLTTFLDFLGFDDSKEEKALTFAARERTGPNYVFDRALEFSK